MEDGEDCDSDEGYCRDCRLPCRPQAVITVEDDNGRALWLGAIEGGADGVVAVGAIEASEGDSDILVARLDEDGGEVELQTYDLGLSEGTGDGVVIHDDGSVSVLVGDGDFFYSSAVMHLDPSGELAWVTAEFDDALPNGLALTPDGELIVSATSRLGSGDSNVAVFRLEEDAPVMLGEFTTMLVGANDNDRGGPVAVGEDGTVYVAALSPSVQGGVQVNDPLVVAFDPVMGKPSWDWSVFLGSTNQTLIGTEVVVDPTGTIPRPLPAVARLGELEPLPAVAVRRRGGADRHVRLGRSRLHGRCVGGRARHRPPPAAPSSSASATDRERRRTRTTSSSSASSPTARSPARNASPARASPQASPPAPQATSTSPAATSPATS